MTIFKQTWWDKNLPNKKSEFRTWIGDKNAESKKYFREYIKKKGFTTLIDLGCGTATEYFAYKEEYPELNYLGVDSSRVLYEENIVLNVPMLHSPAEDTKLPNNHSEVVFSRHVLEHQPTFKPILSEMIRLASKMAIHVFFKVPTDDSYTEEDRIKNPTLGYNKETNLYHNRFNKKDIEEYVLSHDKVKTFEWIKINHKDSGLVISMKEQKKIGIVVTATNAYSVLGINFMKRFTQFYVGNEKIKFYFFSDIDPKNYLPSHIDVEHIYSENKVWHVGNNLRFDAVLSLKEKTDCEYLYYFDADTNVNNNFTEEWFIGDLVGGQHFLDQASMKEVKGYERNKKSVVYIPNDTKLPQMYYYGAFWGGKSKNVFKFCETIQKNRNIDIKNGYNLPYNEKYINHYFHYNPPTKSVLNKDFEFRVSTKGGLGDTRIVELNIENIKKELLINKDNNTNIINGKVVIENN